VADVDNKDLEVRSINRTQDNQMTNGACPFSLKSIWSDGTYQIVLSPEELLEKLAALVPPPRLNLVRYDGVLAPNAVDRAQIVPGPIAADEAADAGENEVHPRPATPQTGLGRPVGARVPV